MARIKGGTGVVQNALYPDPIYNNQLQNESFSNLDYQDQGGVHPPLGFPTNTSNLNYNIHRDPPSNWRENININTLPTYPQPFQQPNMLDVSGQVGEYGQVPGQGNNAMMYQAQKKGFNFPSIFGAVKGGLEWVGNKFQRPEAKQRAYDQIMGSMNDKGYGTYKGNEYRFADDPSSGLKKVFSEVNPYGKNFDSMFGSKSLEEMDEKTLAWAEDRIAKGKAISTRLRNILENRGRLTGKDITKPGGDGIPVGPINQGGDGSGPVTTGGGGTFNPDMDPKGRRNTSDSWHGATASRQAAGKQVAGPGFGSGAYWAKGGRVGYNRGRVVNPGGYQGDEFEDENMFEFMQDQGVPHSEMAAGDDPMLVEQYQKYLFEMEELNLEPMSFEQFKAEAMMAEGESDQGIASIV